MNLPSALPSSGVAEEPGPPNLRLCVIFAVLSTVAVVGLWFLVVPGFEEVIHETGRTARTPEFPPWQRSFSLSLQGLLLAGLWLVRTRRSQRQWWLITQLLSAAAVCLSMLLRMIQVLVQRHELVG